MEQKNIWGKELLDLVLSFPKSNNYSISFSWSSITDEFEIYVHGKQYCECCGSPKKTCEYVHGKKLTDEMREFINKWLNIFKEDNNGGSKEEIGV